MGNKKMTNEILRLKKEKNAVLLVHNYQRGEIQDLADFLGDSLGLSKKATQVTGQMIVFCGVKFMAETAKILSPDKKVLLPRADAGCPMARMVDVQGLKDLKKKHPNAVVVTYVNSSAEVKAESDVCCTSANAVKVVQNIKEEEIIFTPDRNLASYVQRFTEKKIIPWEGFCYVHDRFTKEEVMKAKEAHPNAVLVVHPECQPDVVDLADEVLSTSGMILLPRESKAKTFLIGTEEGILYRLKNENPDKMFYSAGAAKMCQGMKVTRLEDLHNSLLEEKYEINVPDGIVGRARIALERMLDYV
jgi:quinolinate synthase